LGKAYSRLLAARNIGDYGANQHVSADEAAEAIEIATRVIKAVAEPRPEIFKGLEND